MRVMSSLQARFKCDLCASTFTSKANLKYHEDVHRGEKPQGCSRCSATFTRKLDRDRHELEVHDDWRPFVCRQLRLDGTYRGCGRSFARKPLLARHLKGKTAGRCLRWISGDGGDLPALPEITLVASPTIRRQRQPLTTYIPNYYSVYDWYLVTMHLSLATVGGITSTRVTSPNHLFDRVPLPRQTYESCLPDASDDTCPKTRYRLAATLSDMVKVAQELTNHEEMPPLRLWVGMLLLLSLLFHDIEAVRIHLRFIDYLYEHFRSYGSFMSNNPMHRGHRRQLSLGMWSTGGDHFLPIRLANTLKDDVQLGKLSVDRDTIQGALNRFVVDLSSFDLEFF